MRTHSLWLTGIILLTVFAGLFVFKPITFAPRKDPSDASKFLRSIKVQKNWTADQAPEYTLPLTKGSGIWVYKPQSDIRLDLDLRGGMRVVLQIPDRAEYKYKLTPKLSSTAEAQKKQGQLVDALKPLFGENLSKADIVVDVESVEIITPVSGTFAFETEKQLTDMNKVIASVFGAESFEAPKAKDIYKPVDADLQNSVRNIMEARLNATGLSEVRTSPKGTNQVVLEIPGVKDPARVRLIIGSTAQMSFMLLAPDVTTSENEDREVIAMRDGQEVSHEEALKDAMLVVRGRDLKNDCQITYDQQKELAVSFEMKTKEARDRFAQVTGGNVNRLLAIVLDGKIISAPVIRDRIAGSGIISGGFDDMEEATNLKVLLNAGALPTSVSVVENRLVSASLGADSVSMSLTAGIIGFLLVLIFMAAYYRLPGMMANLALIIFVFLSLAVLKFFDVTLSLPGIAGIIISIGMAVDANIIIFERLKEELRTQKPLETALDVAFSRAWTAILDSNVASLITGAVLTWLGTGAVRGFAITLMIGVAVSLFTAVTVTRLFMKLMIRTKAGHKLSWYGA
jgi:protein-export membrane protein SecD